MRSKLFATLLGYCLITSVLAQSEGAKQYKNFPLVIMLQFHAFSVPFRDLKSNFKNIGVGIGTEVSLNGQDNLAQQFNVVWYHNKAMGNGLFFYTQSAWRPTIKSEVFAEAKMGMGYLYSFRPTESFHQVDGEWVSVGHKGKMMFTVPVGISVGDRNYTSSGIQVSPFASYQFLLVNGYNKSIPLVPETLVQMGTRIHFNN